MFTTAQVHQFLELSDEEDLNLDQNYDLSSSDSDSEVDLDLNVDDLVRLKNQSD